MGIVQPQTNFFCLCDSAASTPIQLMAYLLTWLTLITITTGMCLVNGYEVFKVQTHPPHKRGTGEGLSVAFHLMH